MTSRLIHRPNIISPRHRSPTRNHYASSQIRSPSKQNRDAEIVGDDETGFTDEEDDSMIQMAGLSIDGTTSLEDSSRVDTQANVSNNETLVIGYEKIQVSRKKKSLCGPQWSYGVRVDSEDRRKPGTIVGKWMCLAKLADGKPCHKLYVLGNTHPIQHLSKSHGIDVAKQKQDRSRTQPSSTDAKTSCFVVNPTKVRTRLVHWIAASHVPFSKVEDETFRQLLNEFHPSASDFVPTADTIKSSLMSKYRQKKMELSKALVASKAIIHLAYDGWTSPNRLGLLTIVGHWIDDDLIQRRALLGMREADGRHTGENLGELVGQVLNELGLPDKQIGYHMLDNASNNDTTVQYLEDDDWKEKRLRCLGHILHLTATALITAACDSKSRPGEERCAVLSKVRWLVNWVNNSTLYTKIWKDTEAVSMLLSDNKTRWSSVDTMIGSLLNNKDAFNNLVKEAANDRSNKSDLRTRIKEHTLDAADWEQLTDLHEVLDIFRVAITSLQGNGSNPNNDGSIADVLPTLYRLKHQLKKMRGDFERRDCGAIVAGIDAASRKLEKYRDLIDESPVYLAATVCDPRRNYQWITWACRDDPDRLLKYDKMLRDFFDANRDKSNDRSFTQEPAKKTFASWPFTAPSGYVRDTSQGDKEYKEWIMRPEVPWFEHDDDRMKPWRDSSLRAQFPTWFKMAKMLLPIPAMSSEPERVHSSGGLTVSDRRNALLGETIEALECLNHWIKNQVLITYDDSISIGCFESG